MMRIVILLSGSGSNMQRLVEDMQANHYATPVAVISNRPEAFGLERARKLGVPGQCIDHTRFGSRKEFETALQEAIEPYTPDYILLAGFMRILSADFVEHFEGKIINIHPSLLPLYRGTDTHNRALSAGDAEHGATVHIVTAELDAGPILGQAVLSIHPSETKDQLEARVRTLEHELYPAVLRNLANGNHNSVFMDKRELD